MHCPRELAGGEGCPRASLRGGVRCPRALAGVGMVGISISTSRHPLLPDCLTWSDRKLRWGGEEGRSLHPRHCGSTIVVHVTCIINTTKTILLLPYTLCLLPTLDARILRTNQSFGRSYAGPRRALPSLIRSFVHTSPSCLFSDPDYATVFYSPGSRSTQRPQAFRRGPDCDPCQEEQVGQEHSRSSHHLTLVRGLAATASVSDAPR